MMTQNVFERPIVVNDFLSSTMLALRGAAGLGLRALAANPGTLPSLTVVLPGLLDRFDGPSTKSHAAGAVETCGGPTRLAHSSRQQEVHSTTVLCVRKDGQVSLNLLQRRRAQKPGLAPALLPPPVACCCLVKTAPPPIVAEGGSGGRWPSHNGRHGCQAQRAQDTQDRGARDWRVCR